MMKRSHTHIEFETLDPINEVDFNEALDMAAKAAEPPKRIGWVCTTGCGLLHRFEPSLVRTILARFPNIELAEDFSSCRCPPDKDDDEEVTPPATEGTERGNPDT